MHSFNRKSHGRLAIGHLLSVLYPKLSQDSRVPSLSTPVLSWTSFSARCRTPSQRSKPTLLSPLGCLLSIRRWT